MLILTATLYPLAPLLPPPLPSQAALLSDLGGEQGGAGPDAPAHHRLGDPALADPLADLVFLGSADLQRTQGTGWTQGEHRAQGGHMVNTGRKQDGQTSRNQAC